MKKVTIRLDEIVEQFLVARQRYFMTENKPALSIQELVTRCIFGNFRILSERPSPRASAELELLMKKWENEEAVLHLTRAMCLGKGTFGPIYSLDLEAVAASYSQPALVSQESDQPSKPAHASPSAPAASPPPPPALKR